MTRWILVVPVLAFMALVAVLLGGLETADERQLIDSPLVGKPVPDFDLPTLHEPERRVRDDDLAGAPYLLNVWGSWCPACRIEHPWIVRLDEEAPVPLIGLNWKDERTDALRWLEAFGDGWDLHLVDYVGDTAIDLGVYGAPETFLVDAEGIIVHKHIGPIDERSFADLMQRAAALADGGEET
ncbi:MAG: DsbE family thiol:disulfide interchange protein [Wenzhouxiangellaceae bacterium]|nr:DsbE family thiol:disulfide interchange protein [Wenzhouxiangellaceae bacterium]